MIDKVRNVINLEDDLRDTWDWGRYSNEQDVDGNGESKKGVDSLPEDIAPITSEDVDHVVDMEISNDEVEVNEVCFLDLDNFPKDTASMAPTVGIEFKSFRDSLKYYTTYADSVEFGVKI